MTGPDAAGDAPGPSLVKRIGGLVGWVSGSLAGLTAILYAIGFVASKAADQALGIGLDLASRDAFVHVARGASLVMRTGLIAIWPVLVVLAGAVGVRWLARLLDPAGSLRGRLHGLAAPAAGATMLAIAVAGLSLCVAPALGVRGLLFAEAPTTGICPTDTLERAILAQDRISLQRWFDVYALGLGAVLGIGLLARRRFGAGTPPVWSLLAVVAVTLALLGAALAYGALVVETTAPEVQLAPEPGTAAGPMRLLARDADGVLVWLEGERRVRWIAGGQIDMLTVGESRPLVVNPCIEDPPPKEAPQ